MATLSDLTVRETKILQLVVAGQTNKASTIEMLLSKKSSVPSRQTPYNAIK
jgi:FixJ family two-component response regulator